MISTYDSKAAIANNHHYFSATGQLYRLFDRLGTSLHYIASRVSNASEIWKAKQRPVSVGMPNWPLNGQTSPNVDISEGLAIGQACVLMLESQLGAASFEMVDANPT